jgi:hypothetical protein
MYFTADSKDQKITAHKSLGEAAKAVLKKLNIKLSTGEDPVKIAREHAGDRLIMLNTSSAFESIANSDDQAAQELAASYKAAIDKMFS